MRCSPCKMISCGEHNCTASPLWRHLRKKASGKQDTVTVRAYMIYRFEGFKPLLSGKY